MTNPSERRVHGATICEPARMLGYHPVKTKDTSRAVAARSGGIGASLPQRKIIPAFGLPMDLRDSSKISAKARNYRHGIPAGPRLGKVDHRHPNGTIDRQIRYLCNRSKSSPRSSPWRGPAKAAIATTGWRFESSPVHHCFFLTS